ncbi:hypothetical protein [Planctomicrobium sp. SH527]|uniref:hypothetical protein n=1 Tax=Planctomicrobium sp. SH527 TaxID=3448123 RepID=UPI003F5C756E
MSEILKSEDRSALIQCPFEIVNDTYSDRVLTLKATGCSCYGLNVNGQKLKSQDSFSVSSGRHETVFIQALPPDASGEKEYTAELAIEDRDLRRTFPLRCTLQVYRDMQLSPRVHTIPVPQTAAVSETLQVMVEQIYRGTPSDRHEIQTMRWPEWAKANSIKQVGAVEPVEEGLWRKQWRIEVQLTLSPEEAATVVSRADPWSLPVAILNERGEESASDDLLLNLSAPRTLIYPSRILFGSLNVGESQRRRILITSVMQIPFRLTEIENGTPDFLNVTLPSEPAVEQRLELIVTPAQAGPFSGQLRLKTNLASPVEILIDVSGRATDSSAVQQD